MLTRSLSQSSRSSGGDARDGMELHQGGMATIMETLDRGTGDPRDSPGGTNGLRKSNSGRVSIKSHNSVRFTGQIPLGRLQVHQADSGSDPARDDTTPDMTSPITEDGNYTVTTEHKKKEAQCSECLSKGDIFRILDLPDDFQVGLDGMSMTTSKSLAGFRDIPPGAHLLWVHQPGHVLRSGFWFVTSGPPGRIRRRQWNKYLEMLSLPASETEAREENKNMESLYLEMKPYDLDQQAAGAAFNDNCKTSSHRPLIHFQSQQFLWAKSLSELWRTLTDAISFEFLKRITFKRHVEEFYTDTMTCAKGEFKTTATDLMGIGCELRFVTNQIFEDLRALSRSAHSSKDTTPLVLALLESNHENNGETVSEADLVAELQFTFISGTILGNTACLEQWWNVVLKIVLRATGLVSSSSPGPRLARWLLQTLHAQLMFAEEHVAPDEEADPSEDLLAGGPMGNRLPYLHKQQMKARLLKGLISCGKELAREYIKTLNRGCGVMSLEQEEVFKVWSDFVKWLKILGWDIVADEEEGSGAKVKGEDDEDDREGYSIDSEDDDDQPVIVEMDENGREVGLISFND